MIIIVTVLYGQDEFSIRNITFEGNKILSESLLKKQISLQEKSFSQRLLFWREFEIFTDGHLYQDIERLKRFYQTEGFLQVDIRVKKIPKKRHNNVDIVFIIQENMPVYVNNVMFSFLTDSDEERMFLDSLIHREMRAFPLKPKKRFRDEDVFSQRRMILALLLNNGYPYAEVQFNITLTSHNTLADIEFLIQSNSKSYFGEIYIEGTKYIDKDIILKQLTIKPGDLFQQEQLAKNQQRIQQLGVFEYVSVRHVLHEGSSMLPLEIRVREHPRWSIKTGAGYGLDERIRLSLTLRKQPFLNGSRYATLFIKYSKVEPYHINFKITQPAFITPLSTLFLNPYFRKEHEKAYDLQRLGMSVTFQQQFSSIFHSFINYTFERNQLELNEFVTESFILTNTYYNKSKVSLGFSLDRSTPLFFPDKGYYFSMSTTFSGLPGSEYHYLYALTELRNYHRLTEQLVMATKVKSGFITPLMGDQITPIEERFFAGGSNSVRGFRRNELSPVNENNIPVGGNGYLEASLEFRQQIFKNFFGSLFVDVGNVWTEYTDMNLRDLKVAPGVGIRYRTPIGPIRFDIAWPANVSGSKVNFHLSFGQAF
ncbi:MAG: BamA/TamA family outer membrane protein [Candidatus Marinimicrobia bacterium]|nr:BamA/TamA family outer membrane protein [Candidatus Neomarinimicrobiota bacterium]